MTKRPAHEESWTTRPPAEPGFYYVMRAGYTSVEIVEVALFDGSSGKYPVAFSFGRTGWAFLGRQRGNRGAFKGAIWRARPVELPEPPEAAQVDPIGLA